MKTCDSKSLILIDNSRSTNSFEFFTECLVVPTKGDKTVFKYLDKVYVAEPTTNTIERKGTFGFGIFGKPYIRGKTESQLRKDLYKSKLFIFVQLLNETIQSFFNGQIWVFGNDFVSGSIIK